VGDDEDDRSYQAVENVDIPSSMPTVNLDDEMAKFQLHRNVHPSAFTPQQMPPSIVSPFGMNGMHFSPSNFFTRSFFNWFPDLSFGLNENSHPDNFLNLPLNEMQAQSELTWSDADHHFQY
jgi:hypothetical protein